MGGVRTAEAHGEETKLPVPDAGDQQLYVEVTGPNPEETFAAPQPDQPSKRVRDIVIRRLTEPSDGAAPGISPDQRHG